MKESDLDVLFSDDDAICDRWSDLPLLLKRQIGPTVRQVPRLAEGFSTGEGAYPKDVEFGLEPRQFVLDLGAAFRERPMPSAEVFLRKLLRQVELEDAFVFRLDPAQLGFRVRDQIFLFTHRLDRRGVVRIDLVG